MDKTSKVPTVVSNSLHYEEYLPIDEVRDYIKCFWILDSRNETVNINNLLAPSGCIDILFQQNPCIFSVASADTHIQLPKFIAALQFQKGFNICLKGKVKIFGIRLQPFAGRSVMKIPMTLLNNTILGVHEVLGFSYFMLGENVINSPCNKSRVAVMNDFFLKNLNDLLPIDYVVKDICEQIISNPTIPLKLVYDKYRESDQALRMRFQKQVGLHPKHFADVVLLNEILSMKESENVNLPLTVLGAETGHFDQSHFIKKFKSIMTISPGEYFKSGNLINGFFTIKKNISSLCYDNKILKSLKKINLEIKDEHKGGNCFVPSENLVFRSLAYENRL